MEKKHKEYIVIGVLLLAAVAAFVGVRIMTNNNAANITKVEVRYKDEVIKEIDLNKNAEYVIDVELGHMTIVVENGQYYVTEVDCPDKICEKFGKVSKGSEVLIACLPNNIVLVQG